MEADNYEVVQRWNNREMSVVLTAEKVSAALWDFSDCSVEGRSGGRICLCQAEGITEAKASVKQFGAGGGARHSVSWKRGRDSRPS